MFSQRLVVVEILFENGGTESKRTLDQEAHSVCIAEVVSEAIVVGENNGGAVSTSVGLVAGRVRAAHKNYLTTLILVVFIDINGVFSFGIGNSFFGELQHPLGSISAL